MPSTVKANDMKKDTNMKIETVIAGTDSPNRQGYLEGVQKQYAHLKNLRFTGYVEEEDVPVIFSDCDICVFPYSSTTGSSGVLHQAGSYGKAAILPNIGDLRSLVEEEGYSGAFFKPGNVGELANAIESMLNNDEERISIAKKNFAAAAGLPISDIIDWYLIHFQKLLADTPAKKSVAEPGKSVTLINSLSRKRPLQKAS